MFIQAVIDRESSFATFGTFILGLSATEVDREGNEGQSITTEVTIIVSVSNQKNDFQYKACNVVSGVKNSDININNRFFPACEIHPCVNY